MPEMNASGFALLRKWEGCVLQAYDDADGQPVVPGETVRGTLTIGYGHTGSDVYPGLTWTQEQADQALTRDVTALAGRMVPLITASLNDNQFSAFVCLAYNIGLKAFGGSSALHLANQGSLADVPAAIALWDKTTINGQLTVSRGLQNRRAAEIDLWNTPLS